MSATPLETAFPSLAFSLPRLALSELPTPLDDAPALAARLGIGSLAIKRDDLTSPIYGGNKIRKLDYLLADALATGADTVLTYGSVGSNHALATSVFARLLGLKPHAVLTDQPPGPYVTAKLRYLLNLGVQIHAARSFNHANQVFAQVRDRHPGGPHRVYEIPWGGSNWRGAVGFIGAALELVAQCAHPPDYLYVCGGTMGTAIGLAMGLRAVGLATAVVAPRAVPSGDHSAERVIQLFDETNRELHRRDPNFPVLEDPLRNLELRPEFFGPGYAAPTPEATEALLLMRDLQGLQLEMTYTAKALAGLVADARAGRLADKRVVFWNTYNSAPYPEGLDNVDTAALPESLRHYL